MCIYWYKQTNSKYPDPVAEALLPLTAQQFPQTAATSTRVKLIPFFMFLKSANSQKSEVAKSWLQAGRWGNVSSDVPYRCASVIMVNRQRLSLSTEAILSFC